MPDILKKSRPQNSWIERNQFQDIFFLDSVIIIILL